MLAQKLSLQFSFGYKNEIKNKTKIPIHFHYKYIFLMFQNNLGSITDPFNFSDVKCIGHFQQQLFFLNFMQIHQVIIEGLLSKKENGKLTVTDFLFNNLLTLL